MLCSHIPQQDDGCVLMALVHGRKMNKTSWQLLAEQPGRIIKVSSPRS